MKVKKKRIEYLWPHKNVSLYLLIIIITFSSCARLEEIRASHEQEVLGTPTVLDSKQADRAVVKIIAEKQYGPNATGSGIYIEESDGIVYFLTAYHVVEEARIFVEVNEFPGRRFESNLLRANENLDIAVITVSYMPLHIKNKFTPFQPGPAEESGALSNTGFGLTVYREFTQEIIKTYNLKSTEGALVHIIAESTPSHIAGIRRGDLITSVNGTKIHNSNELIKITSSTQVGVEVNVTFLRQGSLKTVKVRKKEPKDTLKTVYSIGHQAGSQWKWEAGYIINFVGKNLLNITGELVPSGVSGGPLFDDQFRVIGICLEKRGGIATALRIEAALAFAEELLVPLRFWLTNEFCARLKMIVAQSDTNFKSIKTGVGQADLSTVYEWIWDANIDLSGQKRAEIIKREYGSVFYRAEMVNSLGSKEAAIVSREIGREIKKCYPDASVSKTGLGLKFEFHRDGWLSSIQKIEINIFGYSLFIDIY